MTGTGLSGRVLGSTLERHHRVRDQLERPRRKRSQRRSELRATIGSSGIGCPTPLATEHHGDEHLEPLHIDCCGSIDGGNVARLERATRARTP